MDIEKLQKLSCLSLGEKEKEAIGKSLDEVFLMMSELDKIACEAKQDNNPSLTVYRENYIEKTVIHKEQEVQGIHSENGFFLAPKVINK